MKAITLWQPWASLLACGAKKYETRSWATNYRGSIAIHAAAANPYKFIKELDDKTIDAMMQESRNAELIPQKGDFRYLTCGCIIATAELVGCYTIYDTIDNGVHIVKCPNNTYDFNKVNFIRGQEKLFGDWTPGRYAWEFANMKMLPEPIPAKGRQRIWEWVGELPEINI